MDAFDILVKQSFVTSGHYNLHFEDFATLSCVSKNLGVLVNEVYGKDNDVLICDKLRNLGLSEKNSHKEHLINSAHLVKALILVKRLVGKQEKEKKDKLVKFCNDFTKSYVQTVFTGYVAPSLTKQVITIRMLLDITEGSKDVKELKYVTCYMTMYFIQKLIKYNTKAFLCDSDKCIMGTKKFRTTVCFKTSTLPEQIRNDVCMLPYGFITRIVRIMGDTYRAVSYLH